MINQIFNCYEARLHTLPEAPTLRSANHEQLRAHSDRLQALNADKNVPRFGAEPNDTDGFFESACHGMLEDEDKWRQMKLVWSWIDEKPVWLSPVDWYLEILPEPEREMERRFRFTMLGGGQITVIESFRLVKIGPGPEYSFYHGDTDLRVTTDAGDGLRRYTGTIDKVCYEMNPAAVLFLPSTPQSVADRVAATFRLLNHNPDPANNVRGPSQENFSALLDRSEQCSVCGRPLRDHVSTLLGIGPDCARQLHLPHGLGIADKILQRRRQLLGSEAA